MIGHEHFTKNERKPLPHLQNPNGHGISPLLLKEVQRH